MPKSGDQVLQDCHDDPNDALRVISTSGGTAPTTTPVRKTATASGALDYTTDVAGKWRPQQLTIHADASVVDGLTVKFKSKTGAGYETLLFSFSVLNERINGSIFGTVTIQSRL